MGYTFPAKILLVSGVILLVSPFLLFTGSGELQCGNEVSGLDEEEIAPDEVVHYHRLSADAQRAFDKALGSGDNTAVVSGDNCPEAFSYSDWPQPHTIEKNGTYYRLETYHAGSGGFGPSLESRRSIGLMFGGFALAVVGVVLFNYDRKPETGDQ